MTDLGKAEKSYHTNRTRILTDMAPGVLLLLIGIAFVVNGNASNNTALLIIGALIVLGGTGVIGVTYLRRFGRRVTLHQNGVMIHVRRDNRPYSYSDISGVLVEAGEQGNSQYRVRDYIFYDDNTVILTAGPVYTDWQALGDTLLKRITAAQVEANMERIRNGYEIVFDEFTEPMLNKGTIIKVNLQGVVQEGKSVLPWERVKTCVIDSRDVGHVDIIATDDTEYARFRYYNAINSPIAMHTIERMAALRRN